MEQHFAPKRRRLIVILYLVGVLQFLLPVFLVMLLRAFSDAPGPPPMAQGLFQFTTETIASHRDSPPAMQTLAARAQEQLKLHLTLYTPDGGLLVSNVQPFPPLSSAELARIERGELLETPRHSTVIPVREQGRLVAYGVLSQMPPDFPPGLGAAPVVVGIMLLLIAVIAVASARALGKPLAELAVAARRIGDGEFGVRLGWSRRDEFGDLARAFDDMAGRITSLLRAEKELMANISHELRTPISRIRVALDIAEEGDPEVARQSLADISQDLSELERVIEDVLTATRLDLAVGVGERGALPLRRGRVEGMAIVEAAVARFRSAHTERVLELSVGDPLPEVDADPVMLRRVIDNLLDNAHKYSDPGTTILLEAHRVGEALEVRVQDRGIGIEAADLERLSTPFFRADQSRTRASGGVGLGLTLARRIVEAHGGKLHFESTPNRGTTVHFLVPAFTPRLEGEAL